MWLVPKLLALGLLPAVWLSGYVVLGHLRGRQRLPISRGVAWCLAPAVSLPAWTLGMSLSAYLGVFHAPMWGAVGWIACPPLWTFARRQGAFGHGQSLVRSLSLAALLAGCFALYAAFPQDTFFVGRDQGTYANQALHIARTGELRLSEPIPIADPAVREVANLGYLSTGLYAAPERLTVQFSPALPVWLAVMFTALGIIGLQGFNAAVSALSAGVFFGVASRLFSRRVAFAAALLLAFNPMQIWISRITLSEVLTQYLVLSGVLILLIAPRAAPVPYWVLGGLTLGASVFVRIDGFVLAPLAVSFAWLSKCLGRGEPESIGRAHRFGVLALLGMLAIGVPFYVFMSAPYLAAQAKNLLPIGGCFGVLALIWATGVGRRPLLHVTGSRAFWIALAVALAGVGLFAYFVRPRWGPFKLYTNPGGAVVRDFRENSYANLGVYVTPVMALLGLAGYWGLLRRSMRPRVQGALLLLTLVIGGYSALYLYAPSISPDHPWGMRRFVPVVIPGVVLAFAYLLDRARALPRMRRFHLAFTGLVSVALLATACARSRTGLFLREYAGAYPLVTAIADAVPRDALLLCDVTSRVFGHLVLGRGLHAMRFSFNSEERFDAAQAIVNAAGPGETYYVLTDSKRALPGEKPVGVFQANMSWLSETTTPPASKVRSEPFKFYLFARSGPLIEPWKELADLGVVPVKGVVEDGFWPTELLGDQKTRWTKDEASLDIPLSGWSPRTLGLRIVGMAPKGTWFTVRANDTEIYNALLEQAPASLSLQLPGKLGSRLRLELASDTFRPIDLGDSKDERNLGVRLQALVLR